MEVHESYDLTMNNNNNSSSHRGMHLVPAATAVAVPPSQGQYVSWVVNVHRKTRFIDLYRSKIDTPGPPIHKIPCPPARVCYGFKV
jgi:hypothetical protein